MTQIASNTLGTAIEAYTYSGGGYTFYTYFAANDGSIRVIVTEGEEILPASDDYVAPANATYKMAQLGINTANGMSYVFTLSDGSYLVYDGGTSADDAALLKSYMGDDPVIAGWIITHAHVDHYGAFKEFLTAYEGEFTLERVFYNAGSPSFIAEEFGVELEKHTILTTDLDGICPDETKLVRVHTGQTIKVRDAEISVL
ncbi:MAG: MBL fold metallo-hydrolase, partial [Clostridia bacterium]|nr:MBL fold metallo-hydrolase [Clostridia bacterium]